MLRWTRRCAARCQRPRPRRGRVARAWRRRPSRAPTANSSGVHRSAALRSAVPGLALLQLAVLRLSVPWLAVPRPAVPRLAVPTWLALAPGRVLPGAVAHCLASKGWRAPAWLARPVPACWCGPVALAGAAFAVACGPACAAGACGRAAPGVALSSSIKTGAGMAEFAGAESGCGRSSRRSMGWPHQITPASVATIRLAKPAATRGRASQAQTSRMARQPPGLPGDARFAAPVPRLGCACAAAPRASRRMASLSAAGGATSASGAWRNAERR